MVHTDINLGRKHKAFLSLCLVSVLTVLASIASAQEHDCCDLTDDYDGMPPNPPGMFMCVTKTVPYLCTPVCTTAGNCKWIHLRNQNYTLTNDVPPQLDEWCCYTKFKIRITKDTNSSTWQICNVSNNWDCKTGCNNAWTVKDVTMLPNTVITEGACNNWVGTFRDIEIFPTNGALCLPNEDCSLEPLNHFLATLCGVKDIQIIFLGVYHDGDTSSPFECEAITVTDNSVPLTPCPDTGVPCF